MINTISNENKDILNKAIEKKGITTQLDQAIEEFAEVIQAINKIKRAGLVSNTIAKPSQNMSNEQIFAYNDLCAEIADAIIMIQQLILMLCPERIQLSYERKLRRLKKHLECL